MLKLRRDISDFMKLPHEGGVGSNRVSYHYKFGDQLARRYATCASRSKIGLMMLGPIRVQECSQ